LITASDVKKIKIPIFTESEEKEVIKFLDSLYTKIKAEKEFMNLLNRQKNYLLRKMFI
jgi:restriction endonuclease S subunit